MHQYTNPRKFCTVDNWPSGKNRVTAKFVVETGIRGKERIGRVTQNPKGGWNSPKRTTYALKARIVDGEDGRIYIAELTEYGHITIMQSNLKFQEEVVFPDDNRHKELLALFSND